MGKFVVAAIDIGTTFSGTAYCFKHEFESDPSKIRAKNWNNGRNISTKTPTTVLIAPDGKTCVAFGYEAEDKFAELCDENKEKSYYYFSRFKMMLHNKWVIESVSMCFICILLKCDAGCLSNDFQCPKYCFIATFFGMDIHKQNHHFGRGRLPNVTKIIIFSLKRYFFRRYL